MCTRRGEGGEYEYEVAKESIFFGYFLWSKDAQEAKKSWMQYNCCYNNYDLGTVKTWPLTENLFNLDKFRALLSMVYIKCQDSYGCISRCTYSTYRFFLSTVKWILEIMIMEIR